MGRKDKTYTIDLHQQAYNKLNGMLKAGEGSSKHADKAGEDGSGKIYSFSTYYTYWKHIKYFLGWVKQNYPDVTTLKKARKHVNEWLELRAAQTDPYGKPLSAWTVHLECAALAKLFQIKPDDPRRFVPPQRNRYDIYRSRSPVESDRHFSKTNNAELIAFCKSTGCRRNVVEKVEGRDYWTRDRMETEVKRLEASSNLSDKEITLKSNLKEALAAFPDQSDFLHHRRCKNGKSRFSPIIGEGKELTIERLKETAPNEKVWGHVNKNADIHSYRADYARTIYRHYARPIETIPYDRINRGSGRRYQSQVYHCRNDERGRKLDKAAMKTASLALGHNRINIIAESYLHGL